MKVFIHLSNILIEVENPEDGIPLDGGHIMTKFMASCPEADFKQLKLIGTAYPINWEVLADGVKEAVDGARGSAVEVRARVGQEGVCDERTVDLTISQRRKNPGDESQPEGLPRTCESDPLAGGN